MIQVKKILKLFEQGGNLINAIRNLEVQVSLMDEEGEDTEDLKIELSMKWQDLQGVARQIAEANQEGVFQELYCLK